MNKTYLNEKNLGSLLEVLFGQENVKKQQTFKTTIVDSVTEKLNNIKFIVDYTYTL